MPRCFWCSADPLYRAYHDEEWGVPLHDPQRLFELLLLEGFQAGLSWFTVLKKREHYRRVLFGFDAQRLARLSGAEIEALLQDPGIIRNRRKIEAAIENARRIVALGETPFGSFSGWLNHHHPRTKEEWVKLFKGAFVFTGGEIVNEFLISTGYLPGAHEAGCPVYKKVASLRPAWMWQR